MCLHGRNSETPVLRTSFGFVPYHLSQLTTDHYPIGTTYAPTMPVYTLTTSIPVLHRPLLNFDC